MTDATRRSVIGGAAIASVGMATPALGGPRRNRVIAVEEAYATQGWIDEMLRLDMSGREADEVRYLQFALSAPSIRRGLLDFDERIRIMDAAGVDMHLLSLTVPGVQMFGVDRAVGVSRAMNDELAGIIARYPGRFAGLAVIPPQAPDAAAQEIQRSVGKLGLNGVIINSHTGGEYLDAPKSEPLLAAAEDSGAAIYLHPRLPSPQMFGPYAQYGLRSAIWGFAAEAGLHMMRLILSGVFDRHPRLQVVLGHMGESIPYWFYRIDNMYAKIFAAGGAKFGMAKLSLPPSGYFKRNIAITTSGMDDPDVLDFCLKKVGPDRIMFAIDYPYEDSAHATQFLAKANISAAVRTRISHGNAERIFRIAPDAQRA